MNWQTLQPWLSKLHPDSWTGALIIAVLFWIGGLIMSRILRHAIRLIMERDRDQRIDRMAASFLSKVASVFVWVVMLMLYAHMIPALDRLSTALLASVSVASIVIGLAAQSTLANFVAGLSLIFYRPFRLGDRIQVNAPTGLETGIVEDVSLGYTVLQTFDNRRVIISNSVISNTVMVNLTAVHPRVMAIVPFSISYDADIDRARAIVLELAESHAQAEEIAGCPVMLLGASSVDLSLRVWCADPSVAWTVKVELTEQIKKRFDAEGIEIPYAYQNVIVKSLPALTGSDKAQKKDEDGQEQKRKSHGE
jgi:small-conductance mechanosensitive channel